MTVRMRKYSPELQYFSGKVIHVLSTASFNHELFPSCFLCVLISEIVTNVTLEQGRHLKGNMN